MLSFEDLVPLFRIIEYGQIEDTWYPGQCNEDDVNADDIDS